MYVNAITPPAQTNSTSILQSPRAENSRKDGNVLPPDATVTISSHAKSLAKSNPVGSMQGDSGTRALAYGELNYGGPPHLTLEEVGERRELWQEYEGTPAMDSFRNELIDLYETEASFGTPDNDIGEKLISLFEAIHTKLSEMEESKKHVV